MSKPIVVTFSIVALLFSDSSAEHPAEGVESRPRHQLQTFDDTVRSAARTQYRTPYVIRMIAINTEEPIIVHPPRRCNRSLFSRASPCIQTGIARISFSDKILVEGARRMISEPNAIMNAGKYNPSVAKVWNQPIQTNTMDCKCQLNTRLSPFHCLLRSTRTERHWRPSSEEALKRK